MSDKYNPLEKGEYFELKFVPVDERKGDPEKAPHFQPLFKEFKDGKPTGESTFSQNTMINKQLLEKILTDTNKNGDKCFMAVSMWVKDGTKDTFNVNIKPRWKNPNPKTNAGGQTPTPDAPAISDGAIDDEIPF